MKELVEEMPDSGYGCAVANRFGRLLDDESDPFDLLYQAQVKTEKKKKKEEVKKVVTSAKTSKKESQKDRKALVRVGDNTANVGVTGEFVLKQGFGTGACAVEVNALTRAPVTCTRSEAAFSGCTRGAGRATCGLQ